MSSPLRYLLISLCNVGPRRLNIPIFQNPSVPGFPIWRPEPGIPPVPSGLLIYLRDRPALEGIYRDTHKRIVERRGGEATVQSWRTVHTNNNSSKRVVWQAPRTHFVNFQETFKRLGRRQSRQISAMIEKLNWNHFQQTCHFRSKIQQLIKLLFPFRKASSKLR